MIVYMCSNCGYTGLPIGMKEDEVYFLGCPNCDEHFRKMKPIGEYDDEGNFTPIEER